MLTIGIKGQAEVLVTEDITARNVGSGTVAVLATPMMIALMQRSTVSMLGSDAMIGAMTSRLSLRCGSLDAASFAF